MIFANLLWFFTSLPLTFFSLYLLDVALTEDGVAGLREILTNFPQHIIPTSLIIFIGAILSTVFLFPATSALFSVVRQWHINEDETTVKNFFVYYKANYKQSILGGLFFNTLLSFMFINVWFYLIYNGSTTILGIIFLIIYVISCIACVYFFCLVSHVKMNVKQILKNSFVLTIGKPITTLFICLNTSLILFVLVFVFPYLMVFFAVSLIAYFSFILFEKMFSTLVDTKPSS